MGNLVLLKKLLNIVYWSIQTYDKLHIKPRQGKWFMKCIVWFLHELCNFEKQKLFALQTKMIWIKRKLKLP